MVCKGVIARRVLEPEAQRVEEHESLDPRCEDRSQLCGHPRPDADPHHVHALEVEGVEQVHVVKCEIERAALDVLEVVLRWTKARCERRDHVEALGELCQRRLPAYDPEHVMQVEQRLSAPRPGSSGCRSARGLERGASRRSMLSSLRRAAATPAAWIGTRRWPSSRSTTSDFGDQWSSYSLHSGRSCGITRVANRFVLYIVRSIGMSPMCSRQTMWPTLRATRDRLHLLPHSYRGSRRR